jgi:hypothetical protein
MSKTLADTVQLRWRCHYSWPRSDRLHWRRATHSGSLLGRLTSNSSNDHIILLSMTHRKNLEQVGVGHPSKH